MASIIKRNNNFCVVYSYKDADGTPKQKWETFTDLSDAKNRKKEVEYKESVGTFVVPQCKTLNDLLPEYVALYGKSKWALSTYQANTALIANYITPLIGSMKLQDITTRVIEGYYQRLLKYEAADPMCGKRKHQFVSPGTVRSVHKILRSAFEQAVKWELMEKNPCIYATLPKYTSKKRDIWTAETLFRALKVCDDPKLRLCINLSFSCSLRLGELLGLTWDCVDISPESIEAGRASIYINKELQRVDVASLNALENKNVITRFPSLNSRCTTVQVLKSPKTDSSIRTIFLPKTVAEMLVEFKAEQDMTKEAEFEDADGNVLKPFRDRVIRPGDPEYGKPDTEDAIMANADGAFAGKPDIDAIPVGGVPSGNVSAGNVSSGNIAIGEPDNLSYHARSTRRKSNTAAEILPEGWHHAGVRPAPHVTLPDWLLDEPDKVAHRDYSTGFYYPEHKVQQSTDRSAYFRAWLVVGEVLSWSPEDGGRVTIMSRNKIEAGQEVEFVLPGAAPFAYTVPAGGFRDADGHWVEAINNPAHVFSMPCPQEVPVNAAIRSRTKKPTLKAE